MSAYGVVIPARNEEAHISLSIGSILQQNIKPRIIVIVDDSSNDRTVEVAESMGAYVVKLHRRSRVSATATPYLAYVINKGLEVLENEDLDYILISGAECVYPRNYIAEIIRRMRKDHAVIASGVIAGERTSKGPLGVRGAGRLVNAHWFKKVGFRYPLIHGYETWLILKALSQGYKVKVYDDIIFYVFRKTTMNTKKAYLYGKAMKDLSYPGIYVLGKAVRLVIVHGLNIAKYFLIGYARYKPPKSANREDLRRAHIRVWLIKFLGHLVI